MRPALFWEITQFLPTFRDNLNSWPLKMCPKGCPKTSVRMATIRRSVRMATIRWVIPQKSADLKRYRCLLLVTCGVPLTVYWTVFWDVTPCRLVGIYPEDRLKNVGKFLRDNMTSHPREQKLSKNWYKPLERQKVA